MSSPSDHPRTPESAPDLPGPPFRADHVGSLLRPDRLLAARDDRAAGRRTTPGCAPSRTRRQPTPSAWVVLGLARTKRAELERKDDLERRIDEAAK